MILHPSRDRHQKDSASIHATYKFCSRISTLTEQWVLKEVSADHRDIREIHTVLGRGNKWEFYLIP